jgi:hypothetical protein
MQFVKFDLNNVKAGSVVEVTMSGVESDVFLVDSTNFTAMQGGRNFEYFGGHFKKSPARISVPRAGNWIAVVVPGSGGKVTASARVISA